MSLRIVIRFRLRFGKAKPSETFHCHTDQGCIVIAWRVSQKREKGGGGVGFYKHLTTAYGGASPQGEAKRSVLLRQAPPLKGKGMGGLPRYARNDRGIATLRSQ